MKERPILFSGPMVKAILDGRKTMTRRVVKKQPADVYVPEEGFVNCDENGIVWGRQRVLVRDYVDVDVFPFPSTYAPMRCPYGVPGGLLWVRESCYICRQDEDGAPTVEPPVVYKASSSPPTDLYPFIRPSIHMPRWASRITLEITYVRAELLQEITEEDARAEGVYPNGFENGFGQVYPSGGTTPYRRGFAMVWDSINGKKYPWASNPWVWVVSFKRI